MELQIRYCTTSDGVSIAWGEMGQGPAALYFQSTPFSHVEQNVAISQAVWDDLASSFRLILFDVRGTGMSERHVDHVSAETLLTDAEAVISAAQLDKFVIYCAFDLLALHPALQLATAVPSGVTHLILESPFRNMSELAETPYGRVAAALAETDWDVFVQTLFRVLAGVDAAANPFIDAYAKAAASWVDAPIGRQYLRLQEELDVSDLLELVRQPTLIRRSEPSIAPASSNQRVAAKITGAQYVRVDDPSGAMVPGMIRKLMGSAADSEPSVDAMPAHGGTRTVLFTDIVGHTEMIQRLGDAKGRDVLREHERITRDTLKAHGGAEVKTMGDGFMASFGSVTSAMECAIALQRAFASHTESMPEPLHVRVGLNAGEPIEEDGDLFGATVILASRIAAKAGAGEILVPDTVRGLLSGKGFVFGDHGEFVPKGFDEGVRLWDVRWKE
jgi:class 3 adenylate cyclase/pimeloyl-ACP methyl ester carboxylesterase